MTRSETVDGDDNCYAEEWCDVLVLHCQRMAAAPVDRRN